MHGRTTGTQGYHYRQDISCAIPMRPLKRSFCTLYRAGLQCHQRRKLVTLAIETSCDDTSVAVLEQHNDQSASLRYHASITSDSRQFKGIHPIAAHISHQKHLATLLTDATKTLNQNGTGRGIPDFVTVTRGPGTRASLATGIDTAKGLAVAWNVPLLGVHHMQAHALTPRLVSALEACAFDTFKPSLPAPAFPYLTLLVSGGHTQLLHPTTVCNHRILASTTDLAIGDMLDKSARDILSDKIVNAATDVSYAKLLESYAFR